MRLICPNCGAQYEVPESVIPETGRDVQCSSCGHTWFQTHPDQDSGLAGDLDAAQSGDVWAQDTDDNEREAEPGGWIDDDDDDDAPESAADRPATPQPEQTPDDSIDEEWQGFPSDPGLTDAPRADARLVPDPDGPTVALPDYDEDDYDEDPEVDLPPQRRNLDSSVADLLREEAEREARARAAERGPALEIQPDLGLDSGPSGLPRDLPHDDDASHRSEQARQRMARLQGTEPPRAFASPPPSPKRQPDPAPAQGRGAQDEDAALAAAAAVAESRRALLPDIEEINSTLRSTSDRRPSRADDHDVPGHATSAADTASETRRGFSRGFSVTLLIAMLLLGLYVFAPKLVEAIPALTPVMDSYVATIDTLRIMLGRQVENLSLWLAEIASGTE